jgi:hypothetical protein
LVEKSRRSGGIPACGGRRWKSAFFPDAAGPDR